MRISVTKTQLVLGILLITFLLYIGFYSLFLQNYSAYGNLYNLRRPHLELVLQNESGTFTPKINYSEVIGGKIEYSGCSPIECYQNNLGSTFNIIAEGQKVGDIGFSTCTDNQGNVLQTDDDLRTKEAIEGGVSVNKATLNKQFQEFVLDASFVNPPIDIGISGGCGVVNINKIVVYQAVECITDNDCINHILLNVGVCNQDNNKCIYDISQLENAKEVQQEKLQEFYGEVKEQPSDLQSRYDDVQESKWKVLLIPFIIIGGIISLIAYLLIRKGWMVLRS